MDQTLQLVPENPNQSFTQMKVNIISWYLVKFEYNKISIKLSGCYTDLQLITQW